MKMIGLVYLCFFITSNVVEVFVFLDYSKNLYLAPAHEINIFFNFLKVLIIILKKSFLEMFACGGVS